MTTHPLIAAALAAPHTHEVVTTYADGRERRLSTRSLDTAQRHSMRDRSNIGRDLIGDTGGTVRIVSVKVVAL